nr:MAG TPA: hypothetical protein [Caudoviricetes sp.]
MVYVNGDSTINGKNGSTKVSKLYKKKGNSNSKNS